MELTKFFFATWIVILWCYNQQGVELAKHHIVPAAIEKVRNYVL